MSTETYIPPMRSAVSLEGREILARAVSIDHDWSLRFSSEDKLIEAVKGLDLEDLEAAALLVHYLQEAIACNLIRRDTAALRDLPSKEER